MATFDFTLAFETTVRGRAEVEADSLEEAIEKVRADAARGGGMGAWFCVTDVDTDEARGHRIIDVTSYGGTSLGDDIALTVPEEDGRIMTSCELAQVLQNHRDDAVRWRSGPALQPVPIGGASREPCDVCGCWPYAHTDPDQWRWGGEA